MDLEVVDDNKGVNMKFKEYKRLLKRRFKKGIDKNLPYDWTLYDVLLNWHKFGFPTPF